MTLLLLGFLFTAPANVQAMNSLPNAAALFLMYCGLDNKCETHKAVCFGQCGNQDMADDMGNKCSRRCRRTAEHTQKLQVRRLVCQGLRHGPDN